MKQCLDNFIKRLRFNEKLGFCLVALLCFTTNMAVAATYTSSAATNWNLASTWGGSGVPGAGDDVIIGHAVTITAGAACRNATITANVVFNNDLTVYGNIDFNGTGRTFTGTGYLVMDGTNSSSQTLTNKFSSAVTLPRLRLQNNANITHVGGTSNLWTMTISGDLNCQSGVSSYTSNVTNSTKINVTGTLTAPNCVFIAGTAATGQTCFDFSGNTSNPGLIGGISITNNNTITFGSKNITIGDGTNGLVGSFTWTAGTFTRSGTVNLNLVGALNSSTAVTFASVKLMGAAATCSGSAAITATAFDMNDQIAFAHSGTGNITTGGITNSTNMIMASTGTHTFSITGGTQIPCGTYSTLAVSGATSKVIPCTADLTTTTFTNASGSTITGTAVGGAWSQVKGGNITNSGTVGAANTSLRVSGTVSGTVVGNGTNVVQSNSSGANCSGTTPGITLTSTAATGLCYSTGSQTSGLSYSSPVNSPVSYTITWNAAASTAGLVDVSTTSFPVSPIPVPVAGNVAAGTYTGSLTLTNASGSTSYTFTLTITNLSATISYSGNPFCWSDAVAKSVTLTGTTGGTYSVSPSGLTINASTGAVTPSSGTPNNYTVTYTMAAAGGCSVATATTSISINTVAPIVTTPVNLCKNGPASPLTATGSNLKWYGGAGGSTTFATTTPATNTSAKPYQWNFSVQNTIAINSLQIKASGSGASNVRVYIYNASGILLDSTNQATISPSATLTFTFNVKGALSPGNYYFKMNSAGPSGVNGFWAYTSTDFTSDLSDGNMTFPRATSGGGNNGNYGAYFNINYTVTGLPTAPTPSTTIVGSTDYFVTQTVSGCESPQAKITVIVNDLPVAPTVSNGTFTYDGLPHTLSAVTTGATADWYDALSGGTKVITGTTTPTASPAQTTAGVYNYYAVTRNTTTGCVSTPRTMATLTINKAVLIITANNQSVCYSTAASVVTGAGTYTASGFVNGETAAVISGTATYTTTYTNTTAAGTVGITITPVLTGLSATNYSFTTANGTITILSLPASPVVSNALVVVMPSSSLTLGATGSGTLNWTGPNSFIATGTAPLVSSNADSLHAGTYSVTSNVNGCVSASAASVQVVIAKYYRSKANGNYGDASTWEVTSTLGGSHVAAVAAPSSQVWVVNIVSPYTVLVNAPSLVNNMIISSGANLTATLGSVLQVYGNWTNNGTFNPGTGKVEFKGNTAIQTIDKASGNKTEQYYKLNIDKTSGSVLVSNTTSVDIVGGGTVNILNGQLDLNSRAFTLKSAPNQVVNDGVSHSVDSTARLGTVTGTLVNSGNFAIERYISAVSPKPRMLSSSVLGMSASQWADSVSIFGGDFKQLAGFPASTSTLYRYDEGLSYGTLSKGFIAITQKATVLQVGKGYRVLVGYDNFPAYTSPIKPSVTLKMRGVPQIGNLTFPISKTGADPFGWNMLGNPYPCEVSWNSIYNDNQSNLSATVAILDPRSSGTSDYYYYNAFTNTSIDPRYSVGTSPSTYGTSPRYNGGIMASSQGFFVFKTTSGSGSVSFSESQKVVSPGMVESNFRVAEEATGQRLNLVAVTGSGYIDNSYLFFSGDARASAYDPQYDAYKFSNTNVTISTNTFGKEMAMNGVEAVSTDNMSIPVHISTKALGTHSLYIEGIETLNKGASVFLEDNYLHTLTELKSDSHQYGFTFNSDSGSVSKSRFVLRVSEAGVVTEVKDNTFGASVSVYPNPTSGQATVKLNNVASGNYTIELLDTRGVVVLHKNLVVTGSKTESSLEGLNSLLDSGLYIVRITGGDQTYWDKLVLIK